MFIRETRVNRDLYMKILLTGSTGYIGRRLLPVLLDAGHYVVCAVRHQRKFDWEAFPAKTYPRLYVIECDFTEPSSMSAIPTDIDVAYYLIHSMASTDGDFRNSKNNLPQTLLHGSLQPLPAK